MPHRRPDSYYLWWLSGSTLRPAACLSLRVHPTSLRPLAVADASVATVVGALESMKPTGSPRAPTLQDAAQLAGLMAKEELQKMSIRELRRRADGLGVEDETIAAAQDDYTNIKTTIIELILEAQYHQVSTEH